MKTTTLGLAALILLSGAAAQADVTAPVTKTERPLDLSHAPADDAAFKRFIRERIKAQGGILSRWGWLQLDDDAQPERFAVVCKTEEYDSGEWFILEDKPGQRWSFQWETDGKNSCDKPEKVSWEREARPTLSFEFRYHGGINTYDVAIRNGEPQVVRFSEHLVRDCYEEVLDADQLIRRFDDWDRDEDTGEVVAQKSQHGALSFVDGPSGTYRKTLSGDADKAAAFTVTVHGAGKLLKAEVRAARPLAAGEGFEVWTIGEKYRPLSWKATWDGARWTLRGLKRAPRELPPVSGDATGFTIPVVRRRMNEERTPLTIVSVSADGAHRVATSELDPEDTMSLGLALPAQWTKESIELKRE